MMGRKFVSWAASFAVVFCLSHVGPALAEDTGAPKADVVGEASSPSPKVRVRVKAVDYQKAEEGPGTLILSGTANAGSDVHVYVDGKPFAQVPVSDSDGTWAVEDKIALDDKVHSVRIEQFDTKTNILSGRAMFSMRLGPPSPADLAAPPERN